MLFPKVGHQQRSVRLAWWATTAFLWLGVLLHLFPIYLMVMTSFKSGTEVLHYPPTWWPRELNFDGWNLVHRLAIDDVTAGRLIPGGPLYVYLKNSVFIAFFTLILGVPVTSFAAYANSKLQRGAVARWSFIFFIGTLMMPTALTLIPSYLLTRNWPVALPQAPDIPGTTIAIPTVRIWDTPWAVILPGVFSAFNFLLFKGFFDTIPDSVIQAARVDGGSEFNIFRRIVFPMSVPVYAVAAWIMFTVAWEQFLWPLIVLQSPDRMPMSTEIYLLFQRFQAAGTTNSRAVAVQSMRMHNLMSAGLGWNGLMVLAMLQSLPVFAAFIVCREYLLKGIQIRGIK
jgi:multiple sugar transport system permease protein